MRHTQKGMSFFGWLAVVTLIVFGMLVATKLLPIYMDHFSLRKIVTSVNDDASINIRSIRDFQTHIDKGMTVNGIRDLKGSEIVTIVSSGTDTYSVTIKYEVRAPLLRSLDLLVHFDETHIIRPLK
ncbi:MAG: DUF4845 domain-containing protein [Halopseudomonas yangmingensis]|uniref:DUF4845 domain-containing protein n=1 Tax=Halopseudomonas yangmingensis TaxID=1720063 RepID=A0A1I4N613_9GAMM|nr:DUF4845 domain-containing protein [Halopseudomonas yangmingensis]SFM10766.1 protein of unknown function [Halopseudomonas yangmingensis]